MMVNCFPVFPQWAMANTRKCQIWAEIGKWFEDIILLPYAESDTGGNFARDEKGGEN